MKKASSIMYLLGRIFEILEVIFSAFAGFIGIVAIANKEEVFQKIVEAGNTEITSVEQVQQVGVGLLVSGLVAIVLGAVVLTLLARAKNYVEDGKEAKKLHIAMIVLGIFTNIFITLGGAFALGVATEKPADEPAEPKQE